MRLRPIDELYLAYRRDAREAGKLWVPFKVFKKLLKSERDRMVMIPETRHFGLEVQEIEPESEVTKYLKTCWQYDDSAKTMVSTLFEFARAYGNDHGFTTSLPRVGWAASRLFGKSEPMRMEDGSIARCYRIAPKLQEEA